jgi:DNA-binding CsgD family transcriptional regulator/PAS domain-containing protein
MATIQSAVPAARSHAALSGLIHRIYEAASKPQEWPNVVEAIGYSLQARKGLLFTPFLGPQEGGFVFPWNFPEGDLQRWATKYIEHDVWSIQAREKGLWVAGAAYIGDDMVPDEEFRESLIYKEYLSQVDIRWICGGIVFDGGPGLPHTSTSYFRSLDQPAYGAEDRAWAKLLLPHLSRSLGLMHRLNAQELQTSSLRSTLDRVAFGVVLLNANMQVVHMNQAMRDVLARSDGLLLGTGRLLDAPGAKNTQSLQEWFVRAAVTRAQDAEHFNDGFIVRRSAVGKYYLIQYSVLQHDGQLGDPDEVVRYVLFVTDPDATQLPPIETMQALYGLTKAESRVALELAKGQSQKEIARVLTLSLPTVRTHTQSIFKKTRVHRHAELVRAILALGQVRA